MLNQPEPASSPSYAKPPIVEASFIIRVAKLPPERHPLLGRLGQQLGERFPKAQLLADFDAKFVDVSGADCGMVYSTNDDAENVQARSDGFSFSQQAPYQGWDAFISHTYASWQVYRDMVQPDVRKVLVKYVNSIHFPLGIPLPELFNTYPAFPDRNQLFDALSLFYEISFKEIRGLQLAVFMTNLPVSDNGGNMLLDNTLSLNVHDEKLIWSNAATLRRIKNEVFESQLTSRLKEQFK